MRKLWKKSLILLEIIKIIDFNDRYHVEHDFLSPIDYNWT